MVVVVIVRKALGLRRLLDRHRPLLRAMLLELVCSAKVDLQIP